MLREILLAIMLMQMRKVVLLFTVQVWNIVVLQLQLPAQLLQMRVILKLLHIQVLIIMMRVSG